jgi:hypothetical protein
VQNINRLRTLKDKMQQATSMVISSLPPLVQSKHPDENDKKIRFKHPYIVPKAPIARTQAHRTTHFIPEHHFTCPSSPFFSKKPSQFNSLAHHVSIPSQAQKATNNLERTSQTQAPSRLDLAQRPTTR